MHRIHFYNGLNKEQYNNKQWVIKHRPRLCRQTNNYGTKWKYKPEFIDYLIKRIDIVDMISDIWMPYEGDRRTHTHWSISPFTLEPSTKPFLASRKKRIFKCFHTGKSGGIIKFVQYIFNYNKKQAITYIVTRYKIDISKAILETKIESNYYDDFPF
jgi:DNA primase